MKSSWQINPYNTKSGKHLSQHSYTNMQLQKVHNPTTLGPNVQSIKWQTRNITQKGHTNHQSNKRINKLWFTQPKRIIGIQNDNQAMTQPKLRLINYNTKQNNFKWPVTLTKDQVRLQTNPKAFLIIKLLKNIHNQVFSSIKERNHNLPQGWKCTRTTTRMLFPVKETRSAAKLWRRKRTNQNATNDTIL